MKTKQTQKNYGLFVEGAQLGRPQEHVPDQTLRGCPNCGHTWFEDLNSAPLGAGSEAPIRK
jgi:hypothetical protein